MNVSMMLFVLMTVVTIGFAVASLIRELGVEFPALTQTGDSSLSPRSVNWLAATAFVGAVLICLV